MSHFDKPHLLPFEHFVNIWSHWSCISEIWGLEKIFWKYSHEELSELSESKEPQKLYSGHLEHMYLHCSASDWLFGLIHCSVTISHDLWLKKYSLDNSNKDHHNPREFPFFDKKYCLTID
jgi:hypothetical protein